MERSALMPSPQRPAGCQRGRVGLITTFYPPHAHETARAARRLASGLARAGYTVFVFVKTGPRDAPFPLSPLAEGEPCVLRVSSRLEGAALLHAIEEEMEPLSLIHAFALPSIRECRMLGARGTPMIATLRQADVEPRSEDFDALRRAVCVTALYSRPLDRLRERAPAADARAEYIVPPAIERRSQAEDWRPTPRNTGVVAVAMDRRSPVARAIAAEIWRMLPRSIARRQLFLADLALDPEWDFELPFVDWHDIGALLVISLDEQAWLQVCEASAAGVPIVTFAQEDVQRLLTQEAGAVVMTQGDISGCAAALSAVLGDDRLAVRLSDGARKAASVLTACSELTRFLQIYADILR
jgi:hypothetical protein